MVILGAILVVVFTLIYVRVKKSDKQTRGEGIQDGVSRQRYQPTPALDTDLSASAVSKKSFDVFVSYSRKDSSIADYLCQALDSINVSYWIDRNGVYSGDNYKEKIVDAILSCKLFLFISSKNSNVSKHTVREVGIAFQSDIPIIPVKIDDADFAKSIYYDLVFIDWIDMKEITEDTIEKFKTSVMMHLNESKRTSM